MNNKFKSIITLALVFIMCFTLMGTSFAAKEEVNPTVEELQKSVVYIESECISTGVNYGSQVSSVSSGTGFAVGIPGEPVQYIATCNHVVSIPSGIYALEYTKNGRMISFQQMPDGTECPAKYESANGTFIEVDHFDSKLVSATAIFSASTGDYTSLSVIDADVGSDVAICKLASEPTDKLIARPFTIHENVNIGDPIYAIGYPGVSKVFNDEAKYDYSDSTVTKGIISKSQLTYGMHSKDKQFYSYQIDAQISGGNSGGPLFLEDGSIIGINAFGATYGVDKANYSIAIDQLIKILEASKIPFELSGPSPDDDDTNLPLIIGAVVAVIVIAAVVIVLIALKNKKSAAPAPKTEAVIPAAVKATEAINQSVAKKYYLLGVNGMFAGKKFAIDERAVFGRDGSHCNVAFPESQPGVSSIHCELVRSGSVLTLKDCNSTYGTFLKDGTKLTPNVPVVLNSGDKFYIGDKSNEFEVKY